MTFSSTSRLIPLFNLSLPLLLSRAKSLFLSLSVRLVPCARIASPTTSYLRLPTIDDSRLSHPYVPTAGPHHDGPDERANASPPCALVLFSSVSLFFFLPFFLSSFRSFFLPFFLSSFFFPSFLLPFLPSAFLPRRSAPGVYVSTSVCLLFVPCPTILVHCSLDFFPATLPLAVSRSPSRGNTERRSLFPVVRFTRNAVPFFSSRLALLPPPPPPSSPLFQLSSDSSRRLSSPCAARRAVAGSRLCAIQGGLQGRGIKQTP